MKFFIKTLFILFLFNSTTQAYDALDRMYSFIGIQGAYTDYDKVSVPTIGLKYGKQTSEWRTAMSYNYAENSDDKFQSFIVQVDRGVLTDLFRDIPLKPYLGFSLGVMEHKNGNHAVNTDRGYLYGLNAGVNYVLNNAFDVDFCYRYMATDKLKYIDNRGDLSLSLHYYFE